MYREIMKKLSQWKDRTDRQPALVAGAKGVGKTSAVMEFAREHYHKQILFDMRNLEDPFLSQEILTRVGFDETVEHYVGETGEKDEVLVIFDHLEQNGKSRLEEIIRFAVCHLMDYSVCMIVSGNPESICTAEWKEKIDFYPMYPVSLKEMMEINRDFELLGAVEQCAVQEISGEMKNKLIQYMKVYFITGGMPKVIQTYMDTRQLEAVEHSLREVYEQYLSLIDEIRDEKLKRKVRKIYLGMKNSIQCDRKNVWEVLSSKLQEKENEKALQWLLDQGLLAKVNLCREKNAIQDCMEKNCRLYFHDIGIFNYVCGISFQQLIPLEFPYKFQDYPLIEQFVFQQLKVSELSDIRGRWAGPKKETIEFLCQSENQLIPVKIHGEYGSGTALNVYNEIYSPDMMIEITLHETEYEKNSLQIPVYAVWNL